MLSAGTPSGKSVMHNDTTQNIHLIVVIFKQSANCFAWRMSR